MSRQFVTALAVLAAAALLVPSVETAAETFEDHHYEWEPPFEWMKWPTHDEQNPNTEPINIFCSEEFVPTWTEVSEYPSIIRKNESFHLGGFVRAHDADGAPVKDAPVEVWFNETKEEPGFFLGRAVSDADGYWQMEARVPFPLEAKNYHIVNHAFETREGCTVFMESWSDPEVGVYSNTTLTLTCPAREAPGAGFTCSGRLVDDVDAPVPNRSLVVLLDGHESTRVTTDAQGLFQMPARFDGVGNHTVTVRFDGDEYYRDSRAETTVRIMLGSVTFEGRGDPTRTVDAVTVVRGQENVVDGQVEYGSADLTDRLVHVTVTDVPRTDCAPECGAFMTEIPLSADGSFRVTLDVPADAPVGTGALTVAAPFLGADQRTTVHVVKDTTLTVHAPDPQSLWADVPVGVHLVDDEGEPIAGATVDVHVADADGVQREATLTTDADGRANHAFTTLPLGDYTLDARYAGGSETASATETTPLDVTVPWWYWGLTLVALAGAAALAWRGRERLDAAAATRPARWPGLGVVVTEPDDVARSRIGLGERARLLVPRVDGATHVLVHAPGAFAAPERTPMPEHEAAVVDVTARAPGDEPVSVAAVSADGTVLARGRMRLRAVRYAEDVEREYRALVRASVDGDAAERVTPREFERFLLDAKPDLSRASVERLVSVFEVADYSRHPLTRADYVAFLEALRAVDTRSEPEPVDTAPRARSTPHDQGVSHFVA